MPLRIKVNHLTYTVRPMDKRFVMIEGGNAEFFGLHDPAALVIYVSTDVAPADQVRVLLHELIHAACHAYAIPRKDRDEEGICLALESPLAGLFRDNPKLPAVFAAAFAGKPVVR